MKKTFKALAALFIWADSILLAACTWLSHKFQRLTGRTNLTLARGAIIICVAALSASTFEFFFHVNGRNTHWVIVLFDAIGIMYMAYLHTRCVEAEKRLFTEKARTADAHLHSSVPFRMVFLYLAVLDFKVFLLTYEKLDSPLLAAIDGMYGTGFTMFLYFSAVTPLPPSKGKIREWLEAMSFVPKTAEVAG